MHNNGAVIGKCTTGHEVRVAYDLDGKVDGGTIGVEVVMPLPDGMSRPPTVVACEQCVQVVREHMGSRP
jgi:hypothetical protein